MKNTYGPKKAESVFYAGINKGTIKGAEEMKVSKTKVSTGAMPKMAKKSTGKAVGNFCCSNPECAAANSPGAHAPQPAAQHRRWPGNSARRP